MNFRRGAEAIIIFDLEWNSGLYDGIRLDEILQIGAVKCDRPGGQVLDSFCVYIHPRVHRRYSPAAQALPELGEAKASHLDFVTAARKFFDWCAGETVFATWGANDFMSLRQNIEYWKLNATLPETYVDLQSAFGTFLGASSSLSLEWAVEYCQVPDIFDPHNALSDAIYTWAVCTCLPDEYITQATRKPGVGGRKHVTAVLPKRKTPWQGPFDGVKSMLNNRGCRRAVCPVCGQRITVTQWFFNGNGPYYAKFTCPQDGPRLWKLETARDKRSRLWANGAALPWTAQTKAVFQTAKAGNKAECRGRKRRLRRNRRKPSKPSSNT